MENLRQIEAAAAVLPPAQQLELLAWLEKRIGESQQFSTSTSVLHIPAVDVGEILMLETSENDLLGEMLGPW